MEVTHAKYKAGHSFDLIVFTNCIHSNDLFHSLLTAALPVRRSLIGRYTVQFTVVIMVGDYQLNESFLKQLVLNLQSEQARNLDCEPERTLVCLCYRAY